MAIENFQVFETILKRGRKDMKTRNWGIYTLAILLILFFTLYAGISHSNNGVQGLYDYRPIYSDLSIISQDFMYNTERFILEIPSTVLSYDQMLPPNSGWIFIGDILS